MPNRNSELAAYVAKVETVEGTDAAPAAVDAIELAENFAPDWDMAFKVPRPKSVRGAVLDPNTPLTPAGQVYSWTKRAWWRGTTGAPTVSNRHELDAWLQAMGLAVTYSGGAGVEIAAYTPANAALKTMTEWMYHDGRIRKGVSARADGSFMFDVGGPLIVECASQGILSADVDGAVITPTLKTTVPPIATDMSVFTVDAFAAGIIRHFDWKLGNSIQRRNGAKSTGGVAGFSIRERTATWTCTLEEELISVKDFTNLMRTNADVAIAWTLGGVQYNKADFAASFARIEKVTPSDDNGLSLVTISGGLYGATPFTLTLK